MTGPRPTEADDVGRSPLDSSDSTRTPPRPRSGWFESAPFLGFGVGFVVWGVAVWTARLPTLGGSSGSAGLLLTLGAVALVGGAAGALVSDGAETVRPAVVPVPEPARARLPESGWPEIDRRLSTHLRESARSRAPIGPDAWAASRPFAVRPAPGPAPFEAVAVERPFPAESRPAPSAPAAERLPWSEDDEPLTAPARVAPLPLPVWRDRPPAVLASKVIPAAEAAEAFPSAAPLPIWAEPEAGSEFAPCAGCRRPMPDEPGAAVVCQSCRAELCADCATVARAGGPGIFCPLCTALLEAPAPSLVDSLPVPAAADTAEPAEVRRSGRRRSTRRRY
jgi:hypothetical protein